MNTVPTALPRSSRSGPATPVTLTARSAVVALRNALREYPETPHREEILYLTVKSCYELAANSVHALQSDRYLDMLDAYYTFISEFPESGYRRELDRLQKTAREYLDKHQSEATE